MGHVLLEIALWLERQPPLVTERDDSSHHCAEEDGFDDARMLDRRQLELVDGHVRAPEDQWNQQPPTHREIPDDERPLRVMKG